MTVSHAGELLPRVAGTRSKRKEESHLGDCEEPFALGGIWDRWVSPDKQVVLESYSIVTVEPNEMLAFMHNRMPLIIDPQDYNRWLEPGDPQRPPATRAWRIP